METFFKIYIGIWSAAFLLALALYLKNPSIFAITHRSYWHFLSEPWKLLTFLVSGLLVTLVAPYTNDPTWDHIDGFFMSVLCFATAPWVVGILYRRAKGHSSWIELYVAVCAWLFSASWSYDIYLVWRDGDYPLTWYANIYASSLIYLCAGLFWSLEWQAGRGVVFSFMQKDWPVRAKTSSPKHLALYGAVLAIPILLALVMML